MRHDRARRRVSRPLAGWSHVRTLGVVLHAEPPEEDLDLLLAPEHHVVGLPLLRAQEVGRVAQVGAVRHPIAVVGSDRVKDALEVPPHEPPQQPANEEFPPVILDAHRRDMVRSLELPCARAKPCRETDSLMCHTWRLSTSMAWRHHLDFVVLLVEEGRPLPSDLGHVCGATREEVEAALPHGVIDSLEHLVRQVPHHLACHARPEEGGRVGEREARLGHSSQLALVYRISTHLRKDWIRRAP